jgi:hypothetical protein
MNTPTALAPHSANSGKPFSFTHLVEHSSRGLYLPPKTLRVFALALTLGLVCSIVVSAQDEKVFINDHWPIRGEKGPTLSPPHIEPTNECSKSVYVDSFIPHATITVFLGSSVIGGPFATEFGFADVPLSQVLHVGDSVTATQKVNGVTSSHSAPMIVGKMPGTLPTPDVDPKIYACGRIVPVHNLVAGVNVEVRDLTTTTNIGNGATPNLWGSNWDPVSTSALVKGHKITAKQTACTGVSSADAPPRLVLPEPSPLTAPSLDAPIIGNDAITAHGLFTGSLLESFQPGVIGAGLSTAESNWMHVSPPIKSSPDVTAQQTLCHHSPKSPPATPTNNIPAPTLVGPICPRQAAAFVRDTTISATLVLLRNNVVVGYGGAAAGDVPLDIAPPAEFTQGDTVQVVEYIGTNVVLSNAVIVGCTSVVTYHNDNQRTGWNAAENTLTAANVTPATFGWIATVPLDDRVDTQPLVVTNQPIEDQGVHTVVYVGTESNTLYAIDSWSGAVLKTRSLGAPVPKPLGCEDNAPNVGINSTPTIDLRRRSMYIIAYSLVGGSPTYRLHELDLGTLQDKPGSPITISASHNLANGTPFSFDAGVQRQRSALLQSSGNIYAGFASFCDWRQDISRGWLLGWNAGNLSALPANELTDTQPTDKNSFFLSSIWMSGFGVAAEQDGDLFFVTGNSDPDANSYTGTTNIQESVVKFRSDLTGVMDLFTPSNVFVLDQQDADYGSGGVMIIPDQPGPMPKLAAAAGKDGRMFILNRAGMGGFHSPDIPQNVSVGACWCGPSYFKGADGVGRVVSSGGTSAKSWKVNSAASPALQQEATSSNVQSDDGGFFTSISSNGTNPGTSIIWAIGRPNNGHQQIQLFAFNATASGSTLPLLWSGNAGTWPGSHSDSGGNANLVPTVADGRVYVPGFNELRIFGLRATRKGKRFPARTEDITRARLEMHAARIPGAHYWGTIKSIKGSHITIALRTGKTLQVNLDEALKEHTTITPVVGHAVVIHGKLNTQGILEARTMGRANASPKGWDPDSPE